MPAVKLVQVAALVPEATAEALRAQAKANERSAAAELRLAIKSWVDADEDVAA